MSVQTDFNVIIKSSLFRTDGEVIDLCEALNALCKSVMAEDETDWEIGEGEECSLDNVIVGAYWAMGDWHGGQSSPEYSTLSRLGEIFQPGMTSERDLEGGDRAMYDAVNDYYTHKTK